MALPTTREEFQNFCLRQLGAPVINIEVTQEQCDDITDTAIHYFQRNHSNGNQLVYLPYKLTSQVISDKFITVPSHLVGVVEVLQIGNSSAGLLTADFQIQSEAMYLALQGDGMANYTQMMSYVSLIEDLTYGEKPIRWTVNNQKVYIDMNWNAVTPESWVIVKGYDALDPTEYTSIWHEPWLLEYTTALLKKQWGSNLKKFTGVQLPGGIQMDGQTLFNEATEDIKDLLLRLKDEESLPPEMFIG